MSAPQRTTPKPGVDVDANTTLEDRRGQRQLHLTIDDNYVSPSGRDSGML